MKLLLLAALAAAALARIPSSSWESEKFGVRGELERTSFQRGSEYEFHYNGQVATGIPGSSRQHSATRIQARVSLVLKGEDKAILKIHDIRMGKMNERMTNPRAMAPFMAFSEVAVSEEMAAELKLPVMFAYEQGLVSDIVFDAKEKAWSANVKKGILNMLQVNLGKRGEVKKAGEAQALNEPTGIAAIASGNNEHYATHEKTVEGECETLYTVVAADQPEALNVTRTIDFENCKRRPEIKYNFRFQDPCEACEPKFNEDQKFLKSSSVAKFGIRGSREAFLIEKAAVESQYQLVPFNREGNMISSYVNMTLELVRAGPIRAGSARQPSNPRPADDGLVYTLDWDKEMEAFLMKGAEAARLPVDIKERSKIVADILRPLVGEMRDCVSAETPAHYAKLVKMLRLSEKSQLEAVFGEFWHAQHEAFSAEEHGKVKAVLTDALADAGSKDAVALLADIIKEGKMSPIRAAVTIKQLTGIRTPSKEIARDLLQLLDAPAVRRHWILKQAVQLTLGSVVGGLCMPTEDRLALAPRPAAAGPAAAARRLAPNPHLCPQQLQEELLEKFFGIVAGSDKEEEAEEAILALKTIGNMGIPKAAIQLEAIIANKAEKALIRTEAILALRQLRETLPQKVTAILMPVFMSKSEVAEVRIAAAYQLLQTLPARPVLDQMARGLFAERSRQVAAFVYTYMHTLANSTNPCEARFARDLQLSLRHGRRIAGAFGPAYSKYLHGSAYSRHFRAGADVNLAAVFGSDSPLPAFAGADLHATALGFWSKNLVGASVAQEGVHALAARALRRSEFSDMSLDEVLARAGASARGAASAASLKELKELWAKLNTVARGPAAAAASPKAFATLNLKDQAYFMLPMTGKALAKLPSIQELRRTLEEGFHFNVHKAAILHEMEYKIPSAIGFPVVFTLRIPAVAQISGQVRIEAARGSYKLHLNNVRPAFASALYTAVTVWNPIVSAGVKIVAGAKACTPVSAKAELTTTASQPELRLSMETGSKAVELIKLWTAPMSWTREYRFPLTAYPAAEYKTIVGEEWNRVKNIRESAAIKAAEEMMEKVSGKAIRIEGTWHRTPVAGPKYLPVCPFSGPNTFAIRASPAADQPAEYVLKISAALKNKAAAGPMEAYPIEMEGEEMRMSAEAEEEETAAGLEAVIKSQLYTKGAAAERKAEMETKIQVTPSLRKFYARSAIQIAPVRGLSAAPAALCATAAVRYPKAAGSFAELRRTAARQAAVGQFKATWGRDECREENKVDVKVAAAYTSEQQAGIMGEEAEGAYWAAQEAGPGPVSPIAMGPALAKAQQLYQYNILATYANLHPAVKNATAKLFNAAKAYYYWAADEIAFDLRNPANTIKAQMSVSAANPEMFNMSIKTPVQNLTITDAKLPMPIHYPAYMKAAYGTYDSRLESFGDLVEAAVAPARAECRLAAVGAAAAKLRTFDGVAMRAPLSDCWTLLAKDCAAPDQPAYAVLVKQPAPAEAAKAVKILTPAAAIHLSKAGAQMKIKVNGKEMNSEGKLEQLQEQKDIQIVKSEDGRIVQISLGEAGVRIAFDGYSASVAASRLAMGGRQCGLCGDADGETEGELKTPAGEPIADARRYIQAHTVRGEQCAYPEDLAAIDASSEELSWAPKWEQEEEWAADSAEGAASFGPKSTSASSEEWDREAVWAPVPRHVVEETGRKICVSAQPVPKCPAGSYPVQYEKEEREVAFRCIDRHQAQAHDILREVRKAQWTPRRASAALPAYVEEMLAVSEAGAYSATLPVPASCSAQEW